MHGDINAAAASEVLEDEDSVVIDNEEDFPENHMEINQDGETVEQCSILKSSLGY